MAKSGHKQMLTAFTQQIVMSYRCPKCDKLHYLKGRPSGEDGLIKWFTSLHSLTWEFDKPIPEDRLVTCENNECNYTFSLLKFPSIAMSQNLNIVG